MFDLTPEQHAKHLANADQTEAMMKYAVSRCPEAMLVALLSHYKDMLTMAKEPTTIMLYTCAYLGLQRAILSAAEKDSE